MVRAWVFTVATAMLSMRLIILYGWSWQATSPDGGPVGASAPRSGCSLLQIRPHKAAFHSEAVAHVQAE